MNDTPNKTRPSNPDAIIPDEVRPALADIEPDPDLQERSGQDIFEDETGSGHVIRPAAGT